MTERAWFRTMTDEEITDAIRDGESILASGNRGAWAFSVELTVAAMRELQAFRAREKAWREVTFDAMVNGLPRVCEGHERWQCDDGCAYLAIDAALRARLEKVGA